MPGSSVRSRTPRLRTPSLGVEVWAISSAGCVSMDDMQLLYSCPIRPVAAFYVQRRPVRSVMPQQAKRYASARMTALPQVKSYQLTSLPPVETATDVLGKDPLILVVREGLEPSTRHYECHFDVFPAG